MVNELTVAITGIKIAVCFMALSIAGMAATLSIDIIANENVKKIARYIVVGYFLNLALILSYIAMNIKIQP